MSSELQPGTSGINDEAVTQAAPMVRALVVKRLEEIWRACEPYILASDADGTPRKPDPRFVEAGIRVVDRLTALYGLLKPATSESEDELGTSEEDREAAQAKVRELEARIRPQPAQEG